MDASTVISATKWIGKLTIEEGKFLYGVQDQVRRLQDELKCMLVVLEESDQTLLQQDDEERDGQLAIYTSKIRQLVFQAEDVIDTYILLVASKSHGRPLLTRCTHFLSRSVLIHKTGNRIEAIINDAKGAYERLSTFRGVVARRSSTSNTTIRTRLETYAHTNKDEIMIGFDDHIQTLVEQLTDANKKSWIVGIVGTGGAGKTTLARKVFNHLDIITRYFKHRAWVSISQQWNRKDVLYEILRKTRGINDDSERNRNYWSERELVEMIYDFLKEQPYLLVLDDTWETKAWDEICDALPPCKGSKIIITTRMKQVPSYADPDCFVLEPRLLDGEESWGLFRKVAIDGRNAASFTDTTKFESLGKEMVAKCGGLPLAIVTLAGLLRSQQSQDDWERINKACGNYMLKYSDRRVEKIIELSYLSLPSHLKPCFLYLGVFPEDVEIQGSLLTKLWIAEGFVTEDQQCGEETLEVVAIRCVDELVQRCILQVVRRNLSGIPKRYWLHDLLRDFCITRAKDQSFMEVFSHMDQSVLDAKISSIQARRATFHSGFSLPTQTPHLRSITRFGRSGPYRHTLSYDYEKARMRMDPIYKNFKLLRVLNLWGIETPSAELSREIGNLIHLRYLAIKATNIIVFPKAIGNLRSLLTLDVRNNQGSPQLDFSVSNMTQIRHIYLGWDTKMSKQNFGLDKLKDLQILRGINGGNWMIKEMKGLSSGITNLKIRNMKSMEQLKALYQCPSIKSGSLRRLDLEWFFRDDNMKFDLEVLEKCYHLQKLCLDGQIKEDISIAKPLRLPPNLVYLDVSFSRLKRQEWITAIGQLQHLRFLCLGPDSYLGAQLNFRTGTFPQLELLKLWCLRNLEEWRIEEGALVCLKKFNINECPKLKRFPEELMRAITPLQRLEIH